MYVCMYEILAFQSDYNLETNKQYTATSPRFFPFTAPSFLYFFTSVLSSSKHKFSASALSSKHLVNAKTAAATVCVYVCLHGHMCHTDLTPLCLHMAVSSK